MSENSSQGLPFVEPSWTLGDFHVRWYRSQELADVSAGYRQNVAAAMGYWNRLMGALTLLEIGQRPNELLAVFKARLIEDGLGRGLARATLKSHLVSIGAVVHACLTLSVERRWASAENLWLFKRPRLKKVKGAAAPREPRTYSVAELERLYPACATAGVRFPRLDGVPAAHWWQALLTIELGTGLRRGALVWNTYFSPAGRRWSDLHPRTCTIEVEGDKTESHRFKPIRREAVDHLLRIKPAIEKLQPMRRRGCEVRCAQYILPFPHCSRDFSDSVDRIWTEAEVEKGDKPLHSLRKTAATEIERAVIAGERAAQLVLDHADPRVTREHYSGDRLAIERQALEQMPWPVGWTLEPPKERMVIPFPAG